VAKLADAIIDLLSDSEKRAKMGEHALRKTREEFSWDQIARKTVGVYKKALSCSRI
jgi:glycosyltransferase involved in cell wall biosynthesis